jgi:type IV pilus assembly protein PilM
MSVGLDIGSQSIKMIELTRDGNVVNLGASGIISYRGVVPEAAKDEKELLPLAEAIKKLRHEAQITATEVNLSLSESQVFTRNIKFPLLNDQEIASAVKWEAEQYIPIPVNEAVIQHQIIERKETAVPPEVKVLLVAVPRELVEKYLKVVQLANLTVVGVETELLALTRSLAPLDKVALVLDFGATSTDIAIAKNGVLVFSRSVPTAGEALTRALAAGLGITPLQAEEYKKTYGLSGSQLEGKIGRILEPVIKLIAEEIKKAIQFYQTEEQGEAPTNIIVSGGTSGMPELITSLSQLLGLEVVLGNPFLKINVAAEVRKNLQNFAPLYSVAVGLALRDL